MLMSISTRVCSALRAIYTRPSWRSICATPPSQYTIDDVNQMFGEARLCLQDAVESKGTVYFEDDFMDAKQATASTLQAFEDLCAAASPQERASLIAANRPKMAQLKEEFRMLEDQLIHD